MSTSKNSKYSFDGTFDYLDLPKEISAAEIKGSLSPNKQGFFKGSLSEGNDRYTIVGHLKNKHALAHLLFVITPYKSVDQHCIYNVSCNLIDSNINTFEGKYTGGWYLTFEELTPKLIQDYHSLVEFASRAGSIDGCITIDLKQKTIDNTVAKRA